MTACEICDSFAICETYGSESSRLFIGGKLNGVLLDSIREARHRFSRRDQTIETYPTRNLQAVV
jgi:hypothetical protein